MMLSGISTQKSIGANQLSSNKEHNIKSLNRPSVERMYIFIYRLIKNQVDLEEFQHKRVEESGFLFVIDSPLVKWLSH